MFSLLPIEMASLDHSQIYSAYLMLYNAVKA